MPAAKAGYESRQVINIDISRFLTKYLAQILKDDLGKRFFFLKE
jgi:transposase